MSYLINQLFVFSDPCGGFLLSNDHTARFHCEKHYCEHVGRWEAKDDGSFVVKFGEDDTGVEYSVKSFLLDGSNSNRPCFCRLIRVDGSYGFSEDGKKYKYGFDPLFKLFYVSLVENETFEGPEDLFPKYVNIPIGATGPPGPEETRHPCLLGKLFEASENVSHPAQYVVGGKTFLHPLRYNFICARCNTRYKDPDIRPFMEGMKEPEMKCKKCDQLHRFRFDSRGLPNGAYLILDSDANDCLAGDSWTGLIKI